MNVPMGLTPIQEYELQLRNRMLFAQQQIAMCDRSGDKSHAYPSYPPRLLLSPYVTVKLQNELLWKQFHVEETEMIITKNGRRMFPYIQLTVSGLEKHERYYILLEIQPACNRRYKYCGNGAGQNENGNKGNIGGWSYAGPAEPQPHVNRRIYMHPDGPATGEHWMQNTISFSKLKLTNNVLECNNVLLTSMHKYIPKIWIIHCNDTRTPAELLFSYPAASFTFADTAFIAVTAYQNENITKLKIDNNPFAKGFRETGQSKCKRKYQTDRKTNDDKNSESESSPSTSSLDNLMQERRSESNISDDDACDETPAVKRSTSITAGQESPLREENTPDLRPFRPWEDKSSSFRQPVVTAPLPSSQTIPPYCHWINPYLTPYNFPQMFMQQREPNLRLITTQYYHPTFHI